MSWGIEVKAEIFIKGVHKDEIFDKITENNILIDNLRQKISMMVTSNPRDLVSQEDINEGNIINSIQISINQELELLEELINENVLLNIAKENIDSVTEDN